MQERLTGHVANAFELDVVDRLSACKEALGVVELRADVGIRPGVPEVTVGTHTIIHGCSQPIGRRHSGLASLLPAL
jgi:hypothetical protein